MTDFRVRIARGVAIAAGLALVSACAPRHFEANGANVRVTYVVSFEGAHVSATEFQQRFETRFAKDGVPMVGLQINPVGGGRAASRPLSTESYRAALDDAHAKAQLLAQHANVALGPLRSVTEQGADAYAAGSSGAPRLKGNLNAATVRGPSSGVTLDVVYDIAGPGGDRTIAVLGFGDERPVLPTDSGPTRALNVSFNGHAATLGDAQRAVARDEALLTQTAAALDRGIRITPSDSSLDAYR